MTVQEMLRNAAAWLKLAADEIELGHDDRARDYIKLGRIGVESRLITEFIAPNSTQDPLVTFQQKAAAPHFSELKIGEAFRFLVPHPGWSRDKLVKLVKNPGWAMPDGWSFVEANDPIPQNWLCVRLDEPAPMPSGPSFPMDEDLP